MNQKKAITRRRPKQRRAQETVEAVLDAVVRILKREGVGAVSTNRIAAVAGVSIGSVYQYFPDKRAIFLALHERHAEQIGRLVESTLIKHADASLEEMVAPWSKPLPMLMCRTRNFMSFYRQKRHTERIAAAVWRDA
jgi:AcrR family transcriptional regulator